MKQLLILRHGDTFSPGETPRRIGMRTDLPLVDSGVRQAIVAGRHLAASDITIVSIMTSPLRRTMTTARLVASELPYGVPVALTPSLSEIDHGPDENRPEDEVIARVGRDALHAWDQYGFVPPGWRVDPDARLRAWRTFFAAPWQGTTLAVTSNGMARFALLAAGADDRLASLKLRTGAFGLIGFAVDANPFLIWWDYRPGCNA